MAGTFLRFQVFFEGPRGQGWSEGWYMNNPTTLTECVKLGANYADVRRKILGAGAKITYVRASDDEPKGDSLIAQIPDGDGASLLADNLVSNRAENGWQRLLVRAESGENYRRAWAIAGLPDGLFDSGSPGGYDLNWAAPWINNWAAFLRFLKAGKIGFKVKNKGGAGFLVRNVLEVIVRKASERRVGRPFDSPRGRRV